MSNNNDEMADHFAEKCRLYEDPRLVGVAFGASMAISLLAEQVLDKEEVADFADDLEYLAESFIDDIKGSTSLKLFIYGAEAYTLSHTASLLRARHGVDTFDSPTVGLDLQAQSDPPLDSPTELPEKAVDEANPIMQKSLGLLKRATQLLALDTLIELVKKSFD